MYSVARFVSKVLENLVDADAVPAFDPATSTGGLFAQPLPGED